MNRAEKIERAVVRQEMLRTALPQDISCGVTVAAGGNVWFRGVLVGGFTDDGASVVSWEPDRAPVPVTDERALEALFRGVFFPADYTDALAACDRHEELMAGDDTAADAALSRLRALEAPMVA